MSLLLFDLLSGELVVDTVTNGAYELWTDDVHPELVGTDDLVLLQLVEVELDASRLLVLVESRHHILDHDGSTC